MRGQFYIDCLWNNYFPAVLGDGAAAFAAFGPDGAGGLNLAWIPICS